MKEKEHHGAKEEPTAIMQQKAMKRLAAQSPPGVPWLLTDVENLCAFARFCDPKGQVWKLIQQADGPETRKLIEHEAGHCPAGRLIVWDRATGEAIEPKFEPSIGLVEDTAKQVMVPAGFGEVFRLCPLMANPMKFEIG